SQQIANSCSNEENKEECIKKTISEISQEKDTLSWNLGSCPNEESSGIFADFLESFFDCQQNTLGTNCICNVKTNDQNKRGTYTLHIKKLNDIPQTLVEIGEGEKRSHATLDNYKPSLQINRNQQVDYEDFNFYLNYDQNEKLQNSELEYYDGSNWIDFFTINYDYDLKNNILQIYKTENRKITFVDPRANLGVPFCLLKKQQFKFCVTNNKNGLKYKFALDLTSTRPPTIPVVQAFDYTASNEPLIVVKFYKTNANKYKIYWSEAENINDLRNIPLEKAPTIREIQLDPSNYQILNEQVFADASYHPQLNPQTLYLFEDAYYVYLLPVPLSALKQGTYSIAVTAINQNGETENKDIQFIEAVSST
ncbi:MAG: hypothetical protein QW331_03730, partial [Candidatus Woesearchaeota archaeon]